MSGVNQLREAVENLRRETQRISEEIKNVVVTILSIELPLRVRPAFKAAPTSSTMYVSLGDDDSAGDDLDAFRTGAHAGLDDGRRLSRRRKGVKGKSRDEEGRGRRDYGAKDLEKRLCEQGTRIKGRKRASLVNFAVPKDTELELLGNEPSYINEHPSHPIDKRLACSNDRWIIEESHNQVIPGLYRLREKLGCMKVHFVGFCGYFTEDLREQQEIIQLLEPLDCRPVFPPRREWENFRAFSTRCLFPLFHSVLRVSSDMPQPPSREDWQAYQTINACWAQEAGIFHSWDTDLFWVHDFHLLLAPSNLSRRYRDAHIGLFLHVPFPAFDLFRCLPFRCELLRGMLCSDVVAFQFFDYARHFFTACKRLLQLEEHFSIGGTMGVDYNGRRVIVKIGHVNVDIQEPLADGESEKIALRIRNANHGKFLFASIDRCDPLSGILLKFEALKHLLADYGYAKSRLKLVQYIFPSRMDPSEARRHMREIKASARRINALFGYPQPPTCRSSLLEPPPSRGHNSRRSSYRSGPSYTPNVAGLQPSSDSRDAVTLADDDRTWQRNGGGNDGTEGEGGYCEDGSEERRGEEHEDEEEEEEEEGIIEVKWGQVTRHERWGLLKAADCFLDTSIRDGLNLTGFEFVACRRDQPSHLLVSEFTGNSNALTSAHRFNPWNLEETAAKMDFVMSSPSETGLARKWARDVSYLSANSMEMWANSFLFDLRRAKTDATNRVLISCGLASTFRVLSLDESFKALPLGRVAAAYHATASQGIRLIFLDHEGTLAADAVDRLTAKGTAPSPKVLRCLSQLCADPNTKVYIFSGRGQDMLSSWFSQVPNLGLVAEHGYHIRFAGETAWRCMAKANAAGSPPSPTSLMSTSTSLMPEKKLPDKTSTMATEALATEALTESFVESLAEGNERAADGENGSVASACDSNEDLEVLDNWREAVFELMHYYAERTQGALIENKGSAMVFQYRDAEPEFAGWQAKELRSHLDEFLVGVPAVVMVGKGYVEVRMKGISKGVAAIYLMNRHEQDDPLGLKFALAVGDDRSDEDMFRAINQRFSQPFLSPHQQRIPSKSVERMPAEAVERFPLLGGLGGIGGIGTDDGNLDDTANATGSGTGNGKDKCGDLINLHGGLLSGNQRSPIPLQQRASSMQGLTKAKTTPEDRSPRVRYPTGELQKAPQVTGGSPRSRMKILGRSQSLRSGKDVSYFTVTVGRKPSAARYYIPDVDEVSKLLRMMTTADHSQTLSTPPSASVSEARHSPGLFHTSGHSMQRSESNSQFQLQQHPKPHAHSHTHSQPRPHSQPQSQPQLQPQPQPQPQPQQRRTVPMPTVPRLPQMLEREGDRSPSPSTSVSPKVRLSPRCALSPSVEMPSVASIEALTDAATYGSLDEHTQEDVDSILRGHSSAELNAAEPYETSLCPHHIKLPDENSQPMMNVRDFARGLNASNILEERGSEEVEIAERGGVTSASVAAVGGVTSGAAVLGAGVSGRNGGRNNLGCESNSRRAHAVDRSTEFNAIEQCLGFGGSVGDFSKKWRSLASSSPEASEEEKLDWKFVDKSPSNP